jgi:serine protease AprX
MDREGALLEDERRGFHQLGEEGLSVVGTLAVRREGNRAVAAMLALALLVAGLSAGGRQAAAQLGRSVSVVVQGIDDLTVRRAVERHHGTVTDDLPIINGVGATVPSGQVGAIRSEPGVRSVSPNARVHVEGLSSPHNATAVYSTTTGATKLWGEGITGAGVGVAVVDTGIADVPDLHGRLVGGIDFTAEANPFQDSFGHGTFVAGLIAGNGASSGGQYTGMAPQANLISLKIAGANGASNIIEVVKALQAAILLKPLYNIRALNLSLGTDSKTPYMTSPVDQAVEQAWNAGIVVVVSSGNTGLKGAGTITKPADDPFVVTVGAVDDRGTVGKGDDVMAGFSGMGPTQDGFHKPDLVASGRSVVSLRAPGSAIDTAYPASRIGTAYFRGSGTSFSTAVTTGSAALIAQSQPSLSPNQVKYRLTSTTTAGPSSNPDVAGSGELNAYGAVHSLSLAAANQGLATSLGTGTLQADCGSVCLQVNTVGYDSLGNPITPDLTSSSWWSSSWWSSSWWSSSWWSSSWWSSSWWSSSWWGEAWYGAWL